MAINLRIQPEIAQEPRLAPRIAVVGVGGAGGNAVNNMIESNLQGVEFIVCNSDAQALEHSKATKRIQLGPEATGGLGAGSRPEVGKVSAEESIDQIVRELDGVNMVFITAGMGGGTGTGAAPVIAAAARERGILTVGVVTKPFHFEGAHRMRSAEAGLKEMEEVVDTLIVIPNQNLFRIANEKTTFAEAFRLADGVLQSGVRGVTDLMVMPGLINLDFNDIRNVMEEMGKAMMGTGEADGESRAIRAAEAAINNPLLDDVSMKGAKGVIINITGGYDMTLFEVDEACNHIRDEVDPDANIIFGSTFDQSLEGIMRVSVVATGIDQAMMARKTTGNSANAVSAVAARAPMTAPMTATSAMEGGAAPAAPFVSRYPQPAQPAQMPYQAEPQQYTAMAPVAPAMPQMPLMPAEPEPILYSPTIKAPAASFVIPSAPPVQSMPELPLMAAAEASYQAEATAPSAPQRPAAMTQTRMPSLPDRPAAPTYDAFDEPSTARRMPSLFERIKGTIRRDHTAQPQHSAPRQAPAAPAASAHRRGPAVVQPTLDIDTRPLAAPHASMVEDELDIPAFLRRQAN